MRQNRAISSEPVVLFLAYVRRRQRLMLLGGTLFFAVGVVVMLVGPGGATLDIYMGAVTLFGFVLALGTVPGRRLVRDIGPALSGPPRTMEVQTWGYRSIRSPYTNRVLATLDEPGSTDRVPKLEVKATWFTPGITRHPAGDAAVYGVEVRGGPILAVAPGGSILGRIRKVRPEEDRR